MASARTRASAALLLALSACAAPPVRFHLPHAGALLESDLDRILEANPLPAGENIRVTNLGAAESASHHLVQVRDREVPHLHRRHDGTVILLRGRGYLVLAGRRIDLAPGDIVFIPRDVPHYFVNRGKEPAVAFVTFSPPFDGKDTVPVASE
jgi:mannose-6-phosphate isomerase-like protein (cupin superfamily)